LHKTLNSLQQNKRTVLGLMSGTSCDGLDVALLEIQGSGLQTRFRLLAGKNYSYEPQRRQALLKFLSLTENNARILSQLNFYLARIWAEIIALFLKEHKLSAQDVDVIGSHGQTIWHQPQAEYFIDRPLRSTLQLGDPSVLAQLTGIPVIGDFRVADMALGGQGAPLIPYFDWLFFSAFKENILAVNIGGISNVTFVAADGAFDKVQAFDCGPGNMLLDQVTQHFFNVAYDAQGRLARQGAFSQKLFDSLLKHDPFLKQTPPKSTGREQYGKDFMDVVLKKSKQFKLSPHDILHTLTRYTAYGIYENYRLFVAPRHKVQKVAVGGGGSRNIFLMVMLQEYFKEAVVQSTQSYDLDDDFKEAIGFAILANETLHGRPSNVPQATGASRPAVLGKICIP